ncbi:MAG: MBL fold metallo-hydrolase [Candidatus Lokiarchaeota archaeon]|nr:MBL fold metallo-hydrolase [Candidatus Lokiarchaeota archaeon]
MAPTKITLLVDDFDGALPGFTTSYGLSILVDFPDGVKVLFDTGQDDRALARNCLAAGLDPLSLAAVVLSHDHFDHTGGLPWLLARNPRLPVLVHRDWHERNSFKGGRVPRENLVAVPGGGEQERIHPGLYLTGASRSSDYGGISEHACWVVTRASRLLITGCCHPGLYKLVQTGAALGIDEGLPLHVIGGFHGSRFTRDQAAWLGGQLCHMTYLHCTTHWQEFQAQFPGKCGTMEVGRALLLD